LFHFGKSIDNSGKASAASPATCFGGFFQNISIELNHLAVCYRLFSFRLITSQVLPCETRKIIWTFLKRSFHAE
jgi:hypothetical protein